MHQKNRLILIKKSVRIEAGYLRIKIKDYEKTGKTKNNRQKLKFRLTSCGNLLNVKAR